MDRIIVQRQAITSIIAGLGRGCLFFPRGLADNRVLPFVTRDSSDVKFLINNIFGEPISLIASMFPVDMEPKSVHYTSDFPRQNRGMVGWQSPRSLFTERQVYVRRVALRKLLKSLPGNFNRRTRTPLNIQLLARVSWLDLRPLRWNLPENDSGLGCWISYSLTGSAENILA